MPFYWFRVALFPLVVALIRVAQAEPSALVLSGGGAKGAYQVGVWKAMTELGVAKDVRVISGTSVGGINAALFASVGDCQKIESVWLDSMGDVMVVNKSKVRGVLQEGVDDFGKAVDSRDSFIKEEKHKEAQRLGVPEGELSADIVKTIEKKANQMLWLSAALSVIGRMGQRKSKVTDDPDEVEGYVDPDKLKGLIVANLPSAWTDGAPTVYVTAVEKGSWRRIEFRINNEPFNRKVDMLRATSAIPGAFSTVEIDGKSYYDGGWTDKGGDNVPGDPVLENHPEIKTVYVVYLNDEKHLDGDREDSAKYSGRRLVEIIPSKNLHGYFGALNFSADHAVQLIRLGYDDAIKVLKNNKDKEQG